MIKWILNTLRVWLPVATAITLLIGLIYLLDQQRGRLGANYPQVQMAEDTAAALAAQTPPASLAPANKVEISQSLAPYIMIFNTSGQLVAGNASLHGAAPTVPAGVFDAARQQGENRVTWQPEPGVRSATVIIPVNAGQGGYVLAGRSLREVEALDDSQLMRAQLGWLATMLVTLALTAILEAPQLKRRLAWI